jgi:hypothetical protein
VSLGTFQTCKYVARLFVTILLCFPEAMSEFSLDKMYRAAANFPLLRLMVKEFGTKGMALTVVDS